MLKRLVLLGAAIASPAAAQDADFTRLVEGALAAAPPPSGADLAAEALGPLKERAAQMNMCVPTAVALEAPRSANADRRVSGLIRAGKVKNGWTVYGRPQGCKSFPLTRFLALRMADDRLVVLTVNFGATFASPSLVADAGPNASMAVQLAVRAARPDCKDEPIRFEGTRVTGNSPDLSPDWHGVRYAGRWTEAWSFSACGQRVEVPIAFTADGQSGAYFNIAASEAKRLD